MYRILQRREEQAEIVQQKLDDLVQADATRLATNKTVATEVGGFGFRARSVDISCFRFANCRSLPVIMIQLGCDQSI